MAMTLSIASDLTLQQTVCLQRLSGFKQASVEVSMSLLLY